VAKAFIVNTNRAEEPDGHPSEAYMLEKHVALVTGVAWFSLIDVIEAGSMVFLYRNTKGIIARGIATEDKSPPENFSGGPARRVKLRQFDKVPQPFKPEHVQPKAVFEIPEDEGQTKVRRSGIKFPNNFRIEAQDRLSQQDARSKSHPTHILGPHFVLLAHTRVSYTLL
jgi:hypothetical protein